MQEIENQGIQTQTYKRDGKKLDILDTHLFIGALPCPDSVENIVACCGNNKTYGVGYEFGNLEFFLAKPGKPKIYNRTRNSNNTKSEEFEYEGFLKKRRKLKTKG